MSQRRSVWLALWTVYVVWGSTYLGIRVAVHPSHGAGLPPLLTAGVRFLFAGGVLLAVTVRRPAPDGRPDPLGRVQWVAAAVVGLALLLGGNGLVSIAEQHIPSGVAALVVATVPIWMAVLAAAAGQDRITARHGIGLALGFVGVAALVVGTGSGRVSAFGVVTVVLGSLLWAGGSVWSRTAAHVRRPLVMTGMEMLCGGAGCLVVGFARGEASHLHLAAVPAESWWALAYLIVSGSLLGYTAYVYLLANAPLSLVTTYAYVNPLVAVLLGALLLSEPLTWRTALAATAIVLAVILMTRRLAQPPSPHPSDEPEDRSALAVNASKAP